MFYNKLRTRPSKEWVINSIPFSSWAPVTPLKNCGAQIIYVVSQQEISLSYLIIIRILSVICRASVRFLYSVPLCRMIKKVTFSSCLIDYVCWMMKRSYSVSQKVYYGKTLSCRKLCCSSNFALTEVWSCMWLRCCWSAHSHLRDSFSVHLTLRALQMAFKSSTGGTIWLGQNERTISRFWNTYNLKLL